MNVSIDITDIELKTEHLLLRPWKQSDAYDMFEYASVPGVGEMAGWKTHASIDESRKIVDMFIAGKKTFALEADGKVIGSLGVERYNEERFPEYADKRCREIGIVISKRYWGRGLAGEAIRAVLDRLFKEHGLDAVFAGHFTDNAQSSRMQDKLGFEHIAFRSVDTAMGETKTLNVRILTREKYFSQK